MRTDDAPNTGVLIGGWSGGVGGGGEGDCGGLWWWRWSGNYDHQTRRGFIQESGFLAPLMKNPESSNWNPESKTANDLLTNQREIPIYNVILSILVDFLLCRL